MAIDATVRRLVTHRVRKATVTLALTSGILILIAAYARYKFGSATGALAYMSGERLIVDRPMQSLIDMKAGSSRTIFFKLTNLTGRTVQFLGSRTSCACAVIGELPQSLAESERCSIQVRITSPQTRSSFNGTLRLFTDDPQQQVIRLGFAGWSDETITPRSQR